MKSFKQYLNEDTPALEQSSYVRKDINAELPKSYSNLYSLGSRKIGDTEYHFHGYSSNRDSPFSDERFHSAYITTINPDNTHTVIGNADFYSYNSEPKHYTTNFPKISKSHSGKGLMSELYKRWADHNKYTLVSGSSQTRGGKNIWSELSQMGTVTAHNTDKYGSKPIVYDSNNPKHVAKFYKSGRGPSSSPTRWIFKYKGK